MQSGRADKALARKVDDPLRNDLASARIAFGYPEIDAGQLECDRHGEDCFRVKSVVPGKYGCIVMAVTSRGERGRPPPLG